jgi:hypothetical protein
MPPSQAIRESRIATSPVIVSPAAGVHFAVHYRTNEADCATYETAHRVQYRPCYTWLTYSNKPDPVTERADARSYTLVTYTAAAAWV